MTFWLAVLIALFCLVVGCVLGAFSAVCALYYLTRKVKCVFMSAEETLTVSGNRSIEIKKRN